MRPYVKDPNPPATNPTSPPPEATLPPTEYKRHLVANSHPDLVQSIRAGASRDNITALPLYPLGLEPAEGSQATPTPLVARRGEDALNVLETISECLLETLKSYRHSKRTPKNDELSHPRSPETLTLAASHAVLPLVQVTSRYHPFYYTRDRDYDAYLSDPPSQGHHFIRSLGIPYPVTIPQKVILFGMETVRVNNGSYEVDAQSPMPTAFPEYVYSLTAQTILYLYAARAIKKDARDTLLHTLRELVKVLGWKRGPGSPARAWFNASDPSTSYTSRGWYKSQEMSTLARLFYLCSTQPNAHLSVIGEELTAALFEELCLLTRYPRSGVIPSASSTPPTYSVMVNKHECLLPSRHVVEADHRYKEPTTIISYPGTPKPYCFLGTSCPNTDPSHRERLSHSLPKIPRSTEYSPSLELGFTLPDPNFIEYCINPACSFGTRCTTRPHAPYTYPCFLPRVSDLARVVDLVENEVFTRGCTLHERSGPPSENPDNKTNCPQGMYCRDDFCPLCHCFEPVRCYPDCKDYELAHRTTHHPNDLVPIRRCPEWVSCRDRRKVHSTAWLHPSVLQVYSRCPREFCADYSWLHRGTFEHPRIDKGISCCPDAGFCTSTDPTHTSTLIHPDNRRGKFKAAYYMERCQLGRCPDYTNPEHRRTMYCPAGVKFCQQLGTLFPGDPCPAGVNCFDYRTSHRTRTSHPARPKCQQGFDCFRDPLSDASTRHFLKYDHSDPPSIYYQKSGRLRAQLVHPSYANDCRLAWGGLYLRGSYSMLLKAMELFWNDLPASSLRGLVDRGEVTLVQEDEFYMTCTSPFPTKSRRFFAPAQAYREAFPGETPPCPNGAECPFRPQWPHRSLFSHRNPGPSDNVLYTPSLMTPATMMRTNVTPPDTRVSTAPFKDTKDEPLALRTSAIPLSFPEPLARRFASRVFTYDSLERCEAPLEVTTLVACDRETQTDDLTSPDPVSRPRKVHPAIAADQMTLDESFKIARLTESARRDAMDVDSLVAPSQGSPSLSASPPYSSDCEESVSSEV